MWRLKDLNNKKNNKIKKRLISISLLLLCIIVILYILYKIISLIAVPTDSIIVENGYITSEESSIGYVIRDEKIAKGNNLENGIYQIKAEGEKVANGEYIFRYYGTQEDTINDKINELNIQEAMLRTNSIISCRCKGNRSTNRE